MARAANARFAGTTPAPLGFADGYPLLVCSQASLEDLDRRLPRPVPIERFRPNIVLRGLPAWAEDSIDTLLMGQDRKSTRLNSSHLVISYAVFCLKKKKTIHTRRYLRCRVV